MGDKSGKLLYWLATRGPAARVVPAIRDTEVVLVVIAQAFAAYYQALYAKDSLPCLVEEFQGTTRSSTPGEGEKPYLILHHPFPVILGFHFPLLFSALVVASMKDTKEADFMLISFILATRNKAHEQPAGRNTALSSRLCLSAAPPPDVTTVLVADWSWRHEASKHRRQTSSVPPASCVNSRTTSPFSTEQET
ncbi:hypothetical protein NDU88_004101 [Pleurodeles waltl]|uniref:Uncharacterized protein n=1 Tax=Pleurodeles waltl TaxID=8319 RepID=A0AAV7VIU4_PLEWA|nr:hypothetical protein NDU88_004101 [Pleurodeles waltl]